MALKARTHKSPFEHERKQRNLLKAGNFGLTKNHTCTHE
jgi:hypothetical protein